MEMKPVLAVSGLGPRAATRWGQQLKAGAVAGEGQLGTRLRRQLMHGHHQHRPAL